MSPGLAFSVLTWVAIAVLFLGLGAVLREVRLLRGLVTGGQNGYAATPDISLGRSFGDDRGRPEALRVVVAADTGCGLCLDVVRRLAERGDRVTVLTHEPAEVWNGLAGSLPVVSDREAWRAVAHLSPPVLLLVDGTGVVRDLVLPTQQEQAERVAAGWSARAGVAAPAGAGRPGRAQPPEDEES